MFAYCGNNSVANTDSTGMLFERTAGGGGGGMAYIGPGGFSYASPSSAPSTVPSVLISGLIPMTLGIDSLRAETMALRKYAKSQEENRTEVATITTQGKEPVFFPENPLEFMPAGLVPVYREGSFNGGLIQWVIPCTKIEVFRWDENIGRLNGAHYHIYGTGHFYPGDIVPEPWATLYFWYRQ